MIVHWKPNRPRGHRPSSRPCKYLCYSFKWLIVFNVINILYSVIQKITIFPSLSMSNIKFLIISIQMFKFKVWPRLLCSEYSFTAAISAKYERHEILIFLVNAGKHLPACFGGANSARQFAQTYNARLWHKYSAFHPKSFIHGRGLGAKRVVAAQEKFVAEAGIGSG